MKKYTYLVSFDSQTLERVGESFAVKGDGGIAELEFIIPSNFGVPANQALWRVFFKLPGEKESLFETLPTVAATQSGDYVTAWVISKAITQKAGRLAFSLAAISGNDVQWNSRTVILQVPESQYQPESEEAEEPYTGRLTALEGDMAAIRGEFGDVVDEFEELKETATLGTPVPKSLASEMVEGGVYLYTGSEPGYTAGHVYYYVNGTLTDGGQYGGIALDATLTSSAMAAPANAVGQIKEDLLYVSGCERIPVTYTGKYINTSGSTININNLINSAKWNCSVVACARGDVFTVNALGGSAPKAWCFIDADGNSLNKSTVTNVNNAVLTAPVNSAYLIINDNGNRVSFYGETAVNAIKNTHDIPLAETAIIPGVKFPQYPAIDTANKTITFVSDTVLIDRRLQNGYKSTSGVASYSSINSTAIKVFYNIDDNAYSCYAYSTSVDNAKNLFIMSFRANSVSPFAVTVSAGFPVYVDGMLYDSVIENRCIKSINHRGLMQYAPENTLIAYRYSQMAGFDYVETDIRFTSDGVPVLLHDASINRTARNTDGTELSETINIADITYEQALEYDFGIYMGAGFAGTKIPTFTEFIQTCRRLGVKPYVELKEGTSEQLSSLNDIVTRNGMKGKVTWISYSMDMLEAMHVIAPDVRLGFITTGFTSSLIDRLYAIKENNEVFWEIDNAKYVTSEGIEALIAKDIPLELYTGTVAQISSADPYISGFTTSYFPAGTVLIRKWDDI